MSDHPFQNPFHDGSDVNEARELLLGDRDGCPEGHESQTELWMPASLDPPYAIGATNGWSAPPGKIQHQNSHWEVPLRWDALFPEVWRVLSPTGTIVISNKRRDQERRQREGQDILKKRLPKIRKLKAMKELLDRFFALGTSSTITEQGQRAIDYIRSMSGDDPQFAECTTFTDYIRQAAKLTEPIPGEAEGNAR